MAHLALATMLPRGLAHAQKEYSVTLIGGDTVATPGPLTLSLTAFGDVEIGQALTRRDTRVNNDIYVSGTIGDAALGLKVLKGELTPGKNEDTEFLIDCYQCARSRTAIWSSLGGIASAAIDTSDELAQDLDHIARQSGVENEMSIPNALLFAAAIAYVQADDVMLE